MLTNAVKLLNGAFRFGFSAAPSSSFTVWSTTNMLAALGGWTSLGAPMEISPGQFQFTDSQAATGPQRFYRVNSP